jgi:Fe(3+) dicitrate transport protein
MSIASAGIRGNQENQVRNAGAQAAFVQYQLRLHKLKFSPGIRYEQIRFKLENYGTTDNARGGESLQRAENDVMIFLPGVGITYDVHNSLTGFAGIHKGFSPPGMPLTNPDAGQAKAETALNYEVGLRFSKASWRGQITGFLNDYDNILGSDNVSGGGFGTGDIFNAGNAVVQGLECSIGVDVLEFLNQLSSAIKLPVQVAYTYTHATFRETFRNAGGDWGSGVIQSGDFIPFITPHLLSITISAEHNRWNASLNGRYVGLTRTRPGQGATYIPSQDVSFQDVNAIGAYLIVDGSCNYVISKNITAFGTVSNLTNNRNIVANLPNGYRPNIPLSFNAGLKVAF